MIDVDLQGEDVEVLTLGAGSSFGEMGVVLAAKRTTGARAKVWCDLLNTVEERAAIRHSDQGDP